VTVSSPPRAPSAPRPSPHPRISRRRQAVARFKRKRLLVGAALVATAIALLWVAFWSPWLAVDKVVVIGTRHASRSAVTARASMAAGRNLLLLSTGRVQEAVEELPWVRRARVDRKLPGTVRVFVTERTPALLALSGGQRWLLDAYGRVVAPAPRHTRLPLLAGWVEADLQRGLRLSSPRTTGALRAWRSLPRRLKDEVHAVIAPTRERITLLLEDGTTVRYGSAQRLTAKSKVLRAVLAQLRAEGRTVAYIDVRVPIRPAVSEAPVTAPAPPGRGPPSKTAR